MKIGDTTIDEIAKVIYGEGSVFIGKNYSAIVAIAQCIRDEWKSGLYGSSLKTILENNFSGHSTIVHTDCVQAVKDVFLNGKQRTDGQILEFRSFSKYSDGNGNPDRERLSELFDKYDYLGSDSINNEWGHFYFGKENKMFRMLVMAGHGRNVDGSWDPGACGCDFQEAALTRELTALIKTEADAEGILCDVAPDRNHYSFFKSGGKYDVTAYHYVLEVHFNASANTDYNGNGSMTGSMFYIDQTETGHTVEDTILAKLKETGARQAWDGVVITQRQYKNGLMVQNHIREQGVSHAVLETCFISDRDDMNWYQAKKKEIAKAVIDGIVHGFGLSTSGSQGNTSYCGYGIATARANESMKVRDAAGINGKEVGTVYTGQCVEVLDQIDGWYKIVWPGASCGYAYTSNVNGKYYRTV